MKIHFVGHACIVAECADTSILMDPWLFGKIFNDSWSSAAGTEVRPGDARPGRLHLDLTRAS